MHLGRVGATLSALVLGQVIVRLGGLLLVPLFLRRWSATEYGEWLALAALAGYLALADPSIHLAAVNALTQAHARGDVAAFRRLHRSALLTYAGLAAVGSLLVMVAAGLLPVDAWLGLRAVSPRESALVLMLLGAYVLWCMPARFLFGTYQALDCSARSQWFMNVQQTAGILLVALALGLGGSMITVAALQLAIMLVGAAVVLLDLRRRMPAGGAPRPPFTDLSPVRALVRPSAFFSLLIIADLITQQGSVILVSGTFGGGMVAVFSISRTLSMIPRGVIEAVNLSVRPEVARVEAGPGAFALRLPHKMLVAVAMTVSIAFASGLWYEGPELIGLWTGGRLTADLELLRLLLALAALQAPWVASGFVTMAVNRHQTFAGAYLGAAALGLALAMILVGPLGIAALPVGFALGEAVCGYHFAIRATCRVLGERYTTFAVRLWCSVAGLAGLGVAVAAVAHYGLWLPSPARALVAMAVTGLLACLLIWWGWLTLGERDRVRSRVRLAVNSAVAVLPPA
jgi:O-antigen/teichoic acid export membrane protein